MPEVGEVRHGQTESVRWTGDRWEPVKRYDTGGYQPGAADSEHPWLARIKGFLSGASEAATPAKLGTLAALAMAPVTGGLSLPAAAALAAGGTALAEGGRQAFGTSDRAKSVPQFLGRELESAAIPAIGPAIGAAARALKMAPTTVSGGVGAVMGGAEGYRRGGLSGAAEGALVGGGMGVALPKSIQALERIFGGGEAAAGGAAAEGGFGGQPRANATGRTMNYGPGNDIPSPSGRAEDYWPARETEFATRPSGQTPMSPRVVGQAPKLEDELHKSLENLRTSPVVPSTSAGPSEVSMTPGGKPAVSPDWYDRPSVAALEPPTPPPAESAVARPTAQMPGTSDPSFQVLAEDGEGPTYTSWAKDMDDIINSATPEETARQPVTGLGRTNPSNAIKAWAAKRGYTTREP